MAIFTPYTNSPADPNYLGLSRTPDAIKGDSSIGKFIDGAGDLLEMGIKGTDEILKKGVESEADQLFAAAQQSEIARLEGIHNRISGGTVPGSVEASPEPMGAMKPSAFAQPESTGAVGPFKREDTAEEPLPPVAQKQLNYLERISQAGVNGKITATGVQMNGEAILSDLLQRYPGRTQQIRAIANRYGFGEGRYASQLRTEINQFQQGLKSKEGKDEAWENANRDSLMILDPTYFQKPREVRRAPDARDQYQQKIGQFESIKKLNETEMSNLSLRKAQNEDVTNDLNRVETNRVALDSGVRFSALMETMGFKGVNSVSDFMTAWRNDPRNQDPKAIQEVNSKFEQYKIALKEKWTRDAANKQVGDKGDTVLSMLKRDALDKIHTDALTSVTELQKLIGGKKGAEDNWSYAGAAARESEGYLNNAAAKAYRDNPIAARMKTLRDIWGDPIVQEMWRSEGSKMRAPLDRAAQAVIDGTVASVAVATPDPRTGKPYTITETLHKYSNDWEINGHGGAPKPQDLAGLMDATKSRILNKNLPDDISIRFANYVFTDHKLFPQLKGDDKRKFLIQYASPEVSKRIFDFKNEELTSNYKKWLGNAVYATTQEIVSNYNEIASTARYQGTGQSGFDVTQHYSLTFNPKTNRVEANIAPDEVILNASRPKNASPSPLDRSAYGNAQRELAGVREAVTKLNQTLAIIDPVLKQEKATIAPELMGLLESMGIKLKLDKKSDAGTNQQMAGMVIDRTDEFSNLQQSNAISRSLDRNNQIKKPKAPVVPIRMPLSATGFAAEELPPSGQVGELDTFLANPAGSKAPVVAKGGNKKEPRGNLSDNPLLSMKVDDIPEGMSARDFIRQLQSRP
jgi:hypothetical protein